MHIAKFINRLGVFMRKERLYMLLLVFILLVNVLIALPPSMKGKARKDKQTATSVKAEREGKSRSEEGLFMKREEVEKILQEKKILALIFSLTSLLILAILLLGIVIDAILVSLKLSRKRLDIQTNKVGVIRWNMWDVAKVVILFLFFGYVIIIIESMLSGIFPILKDDNFRMIINSTVLDILSVVFILYFTVGQYKEKIVSLGLSLKDFFKNVFYGIAGYIATVPILAAVLTVLALIINFTKYVPAKQPVVELFLKEQNPAFLAYTSVFAAVVGPIIEELFFRAFMYSALKKYIGIFWAMFITASIFAVLHTNLVGFLPIMVLGIALAYLYEKTGNLVSSITLHIMHNFSMVSFVFLMKQFTV